LGEFRQSQSGEFNWDLETPFQHTDVRQHGVDTAKYYQQAERELEAERLSK